MVDGTSALRVMRGLYNRSTHSSGVKMKLLRALTATRSQISLKLHKGYEVTCDSMESCHGPQD